MTLYSLNGSPADLPTTPDVAFEVEAKIDEIEHPLPVIEPLIDYHVRDAAICKGPDDHYYLTGTTDDNWGIAEGLRVWRSPDLKHWELLGEDGFVWTFERDGHSWQKEVGFRAGRQLRGMWAPEIHYFNDTFWLTYSTANTHDSGLLRSVSGLAEGPYEDIKTEGPLVEGIDATLFEDTDGSIYYIWAFGRVRKLNEEMSGFTDEEFPDLYDADGRMVGYEGVTVFERDGTYYLIAAEWNAEGPQRGHKYRNTGRNRRIADGRYDMMVAEAPSLLGPYSPSYIAVPHAGHNMVFEDFEGNLWATMFGNDDAASPFRENPAIVPIRFNEQGHIEPVVPFSFGAEPEHRVLYVDGSRNFGGNGRSWDEAFNSIQAAVDAAGQETQIWVAGGTYNEDLAIEDKTALYLYGGFGGGEESVDERSVENNPVTLTSRSVGRVLNVDNARYLRLDGFVIEGGRAEGEGEQRNGGGLYIRGGGETVRIVNTTFKDNRAARDGGGVYATAGSSPLFINCVFLNNEARWRGGAAAFRATETNGFHARFYNSLFEANSAQVHGGAIYYWTELKQTGLLRLMNCLVIDNFTLLERGNITLEGGSNLIASNSLFAGNEGMSNGEVVFSFGDVPGSNRIVNNVFMENEGGFLMGGEAFGPKWVELLHNNFYENQVRSLFFRRPDRTHWRTPEDLNEVGQTVRNFEGDPGYDLRAGTAGLTPGASVTGQGTSETTFPLDLHGNPRNTEDLPSAPGVDVGPVEVP